MVNEDYTIEYKKSVEKDLRKLPVAQLKAVVAKIQALATNPYPSGSVKIRGSSELFRIRYADYRIIYQVHDGRLTILIIKVGHRREAYRDI